MKNFLFLVFCFLLASNGNPPVMSLRRTLVRFYRYSALRDDLLTADFFFEAQR